MISSIPSFATVVVPPGQAQKVTIPEGAIWVINSVAIVPTDDLPATGRVVVYASIPAPDGKPGGRIAIAPLRVGTAEVAYVEYQVNCNSPIVFSTAGAAVSVSVTGYTTTTDSLIVEPV